jgi:serine/threonine protein kinase
LDYLAPEIVGHKQYQYQIDNWCVGVLAYELLSGRAPFEGTDDETKVKIANINYTFPDYFSQLARRFIDNVREIMKFNLRLFIVLSFSFYKKIQKNVCHFWIVLLMIGYKEMHINICLVLINVRFM